MSTLTYKSIKRRRICQATFEVHNNKGINDDELAFATLRVLFVLISESFVHVLILLRLPGLRLLVQLSDLQSPSCQPQKVIGFELVNLVEEAVEPVVISTKH